MRGPEQFANPTFVLEVLDSTNTLTHFQVSVNLHTGLGTFSPKVGKCSEKNILSRAPKRQIRSHFLSEMGEGQLVISDASSAACVFVFANHRRSIGGSVSSGKLLVWDQESAIRETPTGLVATTMIRVGEPLQSGGPISPAAAPEGLPAPEAGNIFYGSDPRIGTLRDLFPRIATSNLPVLIHGETGTGKEVFARHLHNISGRAGRPFVKLNCAAVPSELAESELFGHERGAFTGALHRKPGIFEMANGGTVMLDEIGDMDFRLQAKLLQVLQDQEFRRVGGTETVQVDVRVISATHRDLQQATRDNTFRPDLFFRLSGFTVKVPPLRERTRDILSLAEFLYERHYPGEGMPMSEGLKRAFLDHSWPGNIRELEMQVRKLGVLRSPDFLAQELIVSRGPVVENWPVASEMDLAPSESVLEQAARTKDQAEAQAIRAALEATRWNRKQAAALLNLDYKALLYKIRKLSVC